MASAAIPAGNNDPWSGLILPELPRHHGLVERRRGESRHFGLSRVAPPARARTESGRAFATPRPAVVPSTGPALRPVPAPLLRSERIAAPPRRDQGQAATAPAPNAPALPVVLAAALIAALIMVGMQFGAPLLPPPGRTTAPLAPPAQPFAAADAPAPIITGKPIVSTAPSVDVPSRPSAASEFGPRRGRRRDPAAPLLPHPALHPAQPWRMASAPPGETTDRALRCLTTAVYYEAASEPDDGLRAVAQVVLNRVAHPLFPKTVCGVVYQGAPRRPGGPHGTCQFSFVCDGSMAHHPVAWAWVRAGRFAAAALAGYVFPAIGRATHYHNGTVHPHWADRFLMVARIGAHRFYAPRGRGWPPETPATASTAPAG